MGLHSHIQSIFIESRKVFLGVMKFLHYEASVRPLFFFLSVLLVLIALFLIIYFLPHFYLGQPSLCKTNTTRQLNITWHPLNLSSVKLRV